MTRLSRLVALCASVGLLLPGAASARTIWPLAWAAPVLTDHQPPALFHKLASVSCPTVSMCVAGDNRGNVLVSTKPTGGYAAWKTFHVDSSTTIHGPAQLAVSCPSVSLCVAGDGSGNLVTSSDPTAGPKAWKLVHVAPSAIGSGQCETDVVCGGVACPSASLCVAVDGIGNVITSTDPTGGAAAWKVIAVARSRLVEVTCASVKLCVAFDGLNNGKVYTSTNPAGGPASWRNAPANDAYGLTAGSCPSVSLCVAIDTVGGVVTSTNPSGVSPSWTATKVDTDPLIDVSCPSVSLCVGVDIDGRVLTSTDPTGGAGAWTKVPVSHGLPDLDSPVSFTGVSCPSVVFCIGVDFYGNAVTSSRPTGGNGAWTAKHLNGGNPLVGISCPSRSSCGAIDSYRFILTTRLPSRRTGDWAAANTGASALTTGISCPTTSLCVITDSSGQVAASGHPSGGASTWVVGASLPPTESSGLTHSSPATAVSCASASLCVAVGHGITCGVACGPTGPAYLMSTTNPTGGRSAWSLSEPSLAGALTGVSCPSSELCVAVDRSGGVASSTDPTGGAAAWKVVAIPASLTAISCASSSLCVAVGRAGDAFVSTHPTDGAGAWRRVHLGAAPLTAVSCASATLCVAVGGSTAYVSARPTGGASAWISSRIDRAGADTTLNAVSCPSATLCIAVDQTGNTIRGSAPSLAQIRSLLKPQITPRRKLTAKRLLRRRGYTLHFAAPTPGAARIGWYAVRKTASGRATRVLVAVGNHRFKALVIANIKLRLTARGAALLEHADLRKLIAKATFKPTHRRVVTATAAFTLAPR